MTDNKDFDRFISDALNDEKTAAKAVGINPWDTCIKMISWGLLLTMITLKFLALNYILPAIGVILIYCGVRVLKHENKAFYSAWIFSLIYVIYYMLATIVAATPLGENINIPSALIGNLILISMLMSLHCGFIQVFKKADISKKSTPFLPAAIWNFLLLFAALLFDNAEFSILIGIVFIALIISIIRSIYKLKEILPAVGYEFHLSKPLISNKTTIILYCAVCLIATCSMIFYCNHTVGVADDLQINKALEHRQSLIDIGFPYEIIDDITDEDITALSKCKSLLVGGGRYGENFVEGEKIFVDEYEEPTKPTQELDFYNVYLQTEEKIYVMHYFYFNFDAPRIDVRFYENFSANHFEYANPISGKLVFEKDGKTKIMDMIDYKNSQDAGYVSDTQELTGLICYPYGAKAERGYIIFEMDKNPDEFFMHIFNYPINPFRINYPYTSKPYKNIFGGMFDKLVQNYNTLFGYDWSNNKIHVDYSDPKYTGEE